MKKSVKFFLIFGAVFLVLGSGISFAALAMGAKLQGSYDRYYREIMGNESISIQELTNSTSFETVGIKELELEVGAGNVYYEVLEELKDEIRVSIIEGSQNFDYEVEEGKLKIEYLQNFKGIWREDSSGHELLIQVPEGFQFQKADIELKAGGVWIKNLDAQKLEVDVSAGGVEISEGSVADLDLDVKVGGIRYEGSVSGNITADCKAGGIELVLDGQKEDFDYQVECQAGFVEIDGKTVVGFGGDTSYKNNALKKMDLECKTGGIEVTFQ